MKIAAGWINQYLTKPKTTQVLVDLLERAGIEVDQIIRSNEIDAKVVVGVVKSLVRHPNADRLKIAQVDVGEHVLTIVCGAPNLAEGQKVAVAMVGAVLPDGLEIKAAKIRGESSEGMICSGLELGLNDDHSGILVLEEDVEVGLAFKDLWKSQEVLDIASPAANRTDLLSIVGLAREAAAMSGEPLPVLVESDMATREDKAVINSIEKDSVHFYSLIKLSGKNDGETSKEVTGRLAASGVRPISPMVDLTNYVMFEYGQPMHVFDAAKVVLPIEVRFARAGEKLQMLDEGEIALAAGDLIIADQKGPIALAGIMGGKRAMVTPETTEVWLETACFDGATVRKAAIRHGRRTDASTRFERNLPAKLALHAATRAIELAKEWGIGNATLELKVAGSVQDRETVIDLDIEKVTRVLGLDLGVETVAEKLRFLGFNGSHNRKSLQIVVPWWRTDVKTAEDLIEEVGRSVGYDALPATLPAWQPQDITFDQEKAQIWKVKSLLRSLGLFEVVTYSFVGQDQLENCELETARHLKLKNPMSSEQAYLRSNLLPSLVGTVAKNTRYSKDFGLFEISRVYLSQKGDLPQEPLRLGIIRRGGYARLREAIDLLQRELGVKVTFEKGAYAFFNPSVSAELFAGKKKLGLAGEVGAEVLNRFKITGDVSYLELDLAVLLQAQAKREYREVSKFPSISRDLSVLLPAEITWQEVSASVKQVEFLQQVEFLSDYYGHDIEPGKKAMAIRLHFVSMERTLTDAEADRCAEQVLEGLMKTLRVELRS